MKLKGKVRAFRQCKLYSHTIDLMPTIISTDTGLDSIVMFEVYCNGVEQTLDRSGQIKCFNVYAL